MHRGRLHATVQDAISAAERILPGLPTDNGNDPDPRWQAVIAVSEFIENHPDEVWTFTAKWGCIGDDDLRMAIATCVLEHLLEDHFDHVFPMVEELTTTNEQFAKTFTSCWVSGLQPQDAERLRRLQHALGSQHPIIS